MHRVFHVTEAGRVLLGLVFLCSLVGKVRGATAYREFRTAMVALLPATRRYARVCAPLVVSAEAAAVLLLAIPATVTAGFGLTLVLLGAFTMALVGVLRRGAEVTCHCFGGGARVAPRHVVRNAALLAVALAGVVIAPGTAQPLSAGPSPELLVAWGTGALAALPVVALDDVVEAVAPR